MEEETRRCGQRSHAGFATGNFGYINFTLIKRFVREMSVSANIKRGDFEKWRKVNPDYFKGLKKDTRESSRKWRKNNPDYYKNYRKQQKFAKNS